MKVEILILLLSVLVICALSARAAPPLSGDMTQAIETIREAHHLPALAAMLIEDGKINWDTTIIDVFPKFKGLIDPQYENVTVEQLLTHRGGVPHNPPAAAWARAWKQQGTPMQQRYQFIEAVLSPPPEAPPGTKWIYSN